MSQDFLYNYETDHPVAVKFDGDMVWVTLADGRMLGTPVARHPWLASATTAQRDNFELDPFAVYWPELDDGLDIEWMRRESESGRVKIGLAAISYMADWLQNLEILQIDIIQSHGEQTTEAKLVQPDATPTTKFFINGVLTYSPRVNYATSATLTREKRVS